MIEKKPTLCIDDQLPCLLYRTTEGRLFKQYVEDIPEWASMLLA